MKTDRVNLISSRQATQADLPFLLALRRHTMVPHQIASGGIQSEEEHVRRILCHYECARVLVIAIEPIGLFKVLRDGLIWELLQIQLVPSMQGQGIGTRLVRQLVSEAQSVGASLHLTVLKANPARCLYERLGFSIVFEQAYAFRMQRAPQSRAGDG